MLRFMLQVIPDNIGTQPGNHFCNQKYSRRRLSNIGLFKLFAGPDKEYGKQHTENQPVDNRLLKFDVVSKQCQNDSVKLIVHYSSSFLCFQL